jgi:hypothetical protein
MKGKSSGNWSLFRLSDRKQFDRVDLATIDFFYRALPDALYSDWLMWRDGFSGWRPFSELPLILKHLKKEDDVVQPPPVPEAILKFADELTASGVHSVDAPTVEGEAKFEIPEHDIPIVAEKAVHGTVEQDPDGDEPEESREIAVKHNMPATKPGVAPANATSAHENTHSSVSIRALQAAATSSLRIKTNPNVIAGGAAAVAKGSQVSHSRATPEELQPVAGKVLTMPDEATLSLMLESQAATEDRNNVRYHKKFKIRIFTPKGIVPMTTIDCSISGFKLKDPLPEGLPRFFHVEIDLGPDGKIPLICSEVREKDGRPATRVRIQVNDYVQTFRSALMRAS